VSTPVAARSTARTDSIPAAPILLQEKPSAAPAPVIVSTRAERMAAIQKEFDDAMEAYHAAFKDAKTPEERKAISDKVARPDPAPLRVRARALVDENPTDAVALDAITWMMTGGRLGSDQDELLTLVEAFHMQSENLVELCEMMANTRTGHAPAFVERVIAENGHRNVVGKACFGLAQAELREVNSARRAQGLTDQEQIDKWKERVGADRAVALLALDASAQEKHAEKLLLRVVDEFADVAGYELTLGEQAGNTLYELHNLAVGMKAPEIQGEDLAAAQFKLSDYRGKVVMLDYWGNW
jgi:hypothetical protein